MMRQLTPRRTVQRGYDDDAKLIRSLNGDWIQLKF